MPILAPLAEDLLELQLQEPTGGPEALVCPSRAGTPMSPNDWRRRVFTPAAAAAGVEWATPYSGRRSYISWQIWAGIDPVSVAKWAGNSPAIIWKSYAREFERSEVAERRPAADALLAARRAAGGQTVATWGELVELADHRKNAKNPALTGLSVERETGLEPATLSLEG